MREAERRVRRSVSRERSDPAQRAAASGGHPPARRAAGAESARSASRDAGQPTAGGTGSSGAVGGQTALIRRRAVSGSRRQSSAVGAPPSRVAVSRVTALPAAPTALGRALARVSAPLRPAGAVAGPLSSTAAAAVARAEEASRAAKVAAASAAEALRGRQAEPVQHPRRGRAASRGGAGGDRRAGAGVAGSEATAAGAALPASAPRQQLPQQQLPQQQPRSPPRPLRPPREATARQIGDAGSEGPLDAEFDIDIDGRAGILGSGAAVSAPAPGFWTSRAAGTLVAEAARREGGRIGAEPSGHGAAPTPWRSRSQRRDCAIRWRGLGAPGARSPPPDDASPAARSPASQQRSARASPWRRVGSGTVDPEGPTSRPSCSSGGTARASRFSGTASRQAGAGSAGVPQLLREMEDAAAELEQRWRESQERRTRRRHRLRHSDERRGSGADEPAAPPAGTGSPAAAPAPPPQAPACEGCGEGGSGGGAGTGGRGGQFGAEPVLPGVPDLPPASPPRESDALLAQLRDAASLSTQLSERAILAERRCEELHARLSDAVGAVEDLSGRYAGAERAAAESRRAAERQRRRAAQAERRASLLEAELDAVRRRTRSSLSRVSSKAVRLVRDARRSADDEVEAAAAAFSDGESVGRAAGAVAFNEPLRAAASMAWLAGADAAANGLPAAGRRAGPQPPPEPLASGAPQRGIEEAAGAGAAVGLLGSDSGSGLGDSPPAPDPLRELPGGRDEGSGLAEARGRVDTAGRGVAWLAGIPAGPRSATADISDSDLTQHLAGSGFRG